MGYALFTRPHRAREAPRRCAGMWLLGILPGLFWQAVRLTCCAILILMEPLLRATLVPLAFLSFIVTLIFGFVVGDPRFPRWGMLALSIGSLMLYWLFLGLVSVFIELPPTHDR